MNRKNTKRIMRNVLFITLFNDNKNLYEINCFLGTHILKLNPKIVRNITKPVTLEDVTIKLFFPKIKERFKKFHRDFY